MLRKGGPEALRRLPARAALLAPDSDAAVSIDRFSPNRSKNEQASSESLSCSAHTELAPGSSPAAPPPALGPQGGTRCPPAQALRSARLDSLHGACDGAGGHDVISFASVTLKG